MQWRGSIRAGTPIQRGTGAASSGAGTGRWRASPKRPACAASARQGRGGESARGMQRSRLRSQRRLDARTAVCGVLAMPDLQVEQRPEQLLVVLPARAVLVEDAGQDAGVVPG